MSKEVTHTDQVIDQVNRLRAMLAIDEKLQLYLLSFDDSRVNQHIRSHSTQAVDRQLAGLRALVSDDPHEQPASDNVAQAMALRSAIFTDAAASSDNRPQPVTDAIIKDHLEPALAGIGARLDAIAMVENTLLRQRIEEKRQALYVAILVTLGCLALAIVIIVVITSYLEKTSDDRANAFNESRRATSRLDGLKRSFEARVAARTAALQENAELLESIIDAVDDGVIGCDAEFRTTRVNRAASRLLAADPNAFELANWANEHTVTLGENPIPLALPQLPIVQATRGEFPSRVELHVTNPKIAGEAWLEVSAHPTRDAKDNITGAVAIFRDISDRKRNQDSLRIARDIAVESARLRSEYLANLSRDIRTPLNGLLDSAELLKLTNLDTQQREFADTIWTTSELLRTIADEILDFSKMAKGNGPTA
jgi:PAS domain-containing protein